MTYQVFTRAQVRSMLQDRWEGSPFWTATQANNAINEALLWWNLLTGYWKTSAAVPTIALRHELDLPDALVFGARVRFAGAPVAVTSVRDLALVRPTWEGETIASGGTVPTTIKRWFPIGLTRIGVWPAHTGVANLTVDGIAATPLLLADGQFIDLDESEVAIIIGEALHISAFKLGGTVLQATAPLHQLFLLAAGDRNSLLKGSAFFRKLLGAADQQRRLHRLRVPGDATAVAQTGARG